MTKCPDVQVKAKKENAGKAMLKGIVYSREPPKDSIIFLRVNGFNVFWLKNRKINGDPDSENALNKFLSGTYI